MDSTATLDALYGLGHWLIAQQRLLDALHVFRTFLMSAPDDERGWLGLGTCHEQLGHLGTARDLFTLGAATLPASFRCALAEARLRRRLDDDRADGAYENAIARAEAADDAEIIAAIMHERAAA